MGWLKKFWEILKMAVASTRPDVVVCGIDEPSLILGVLLGILRKVRVFALVEDPPFTGRYERSIGFVAKVERRLRTRLLHHLLETCVGIFCFIEKEAIEEFNLKNPQIFQMMNGPSALARDWAQRRSANVGNHGEFIVGLVGTLTPAQGLDSLLEICTEAKRHITHLKLRLIGPMDPHYKPEYRETLKRLGLDSQVEVTGWLPYVKMLERLEKCSIGVYCNPHTEWFRSAQPLKICEYLALTKPTVAWDYPGTRRLLDHGRLGILVPPGNKSAFMEAIVSLGDTAARESIQKEIRLAVEDQWSSNYWHGKVLEIINCSTFPETRI